MLKAGDKARKAKPPRSAAAVRAYQGANSIDPKEARAHGGLGGVHAAQGRYADAVCASAEASTLNPERAELHYRSGVIFQKTGETAAAREKLQLLRPMKKKELAARLESQLGPAPEQDANQ